MKYIKYYENIKPQIGDYIACKSDEIIFKYYLENNIGKIISYNYRANQYYVEFYEIPPELIINRFTKKKGKFLRWFNDPEDIIEFAPTKEKVLLKLSAKKYNI